MNVIFFHYLITFGQTSLLKHFFLANIKMYCITYFKMFMRFSLYTAMKPISKQDRPCTYKRHFEARSSNNFCCGKAIRITYSECMFIAVCIQYAKCMHRVILWHVAHPAVQYFSTLSHKRHDFRKKKNENKICFYFFYIFYPKHFSF